MKINNLDFGKGYRLISITNDFGLTATFSDLGARIVSLKLNHRELIWGFDSANEYLTIDTTFGATIGRTAGRIAQATFDLDHNTYTLSTNDGTSNLHGGMPGFESKKWDFHIIEGVNESSVIFNLTSEEGENGFPGALDVEVKHTITNNNIWRITTRGISNKKTLFNPTNHVYFNLSGNLNTPIDQHSLYLNSNAYAPLNPDVTPIGTIEDVWNTAFDFQMKKKLATFFNSQHPQKEMVNGLDHPFFFKNVGLQHKQIELMSPDNKISLEVYTDCPTVVLFSANFNYNIPMKNQQVGFRNGLTFETQIAPGAEKYSSFGNITLEKYQPKETITEYKLINR